MLTWVILLFVAGVILIFAEFLLPSGLSGGAGTLMILASVALGLYHFPDQAVWIIGGETFGVMFGIAMGIFALSKGMGKTLMLDTTQAVEDGYVNVETDTALIGATGETMTALRPAGTILVDGKRIDAISDGTFIDEHANVRVIEVNGNRVVVERASMS